jgi:hypothetical protein
MFLYQSCANQQPHNRYILRILQLAPSGGDQLQIGILAEVEHWFATCYYNRNSTTKRFLSISQFSIMAYTWVIFYVDPGGTKLKSASLFLQSLNCLCLQTPLTATSRLNTLYKKTQIFGASAGVGPIDVTDRHQFTPILKVIEMLHKTFLASWELWYPYLQALLNLYDDDNVLAKKTQGLVQDSVLIPSIHPDHPTDEDICRFLKHHWLGIHLSHTKSSKTLSHRRTSKMKIFILPRTLLSNGCLQPRQVSPVKIIISTWSLI